MKLNFLQARYLTPDSNSGGIANRGSASGLPLEPAQAPRHGKQVIGYITQYDGWKEINGVVPKGGYNHLNVDYSKYTIINFSFFGVAKDGSLHSADFRNKDIWKPGVDQEPAPLLYTDLYSSFDLHILFGALENKWSVNWAGEQLEQAWDKDFNPLPPGKYEPDSDGWANKAAGVRGAFPLLVPGKAKGLLALCKEKGVKCMASLGGWSMSKHFGDVVADTGKRRKLMEDCRKLIDMGFDGIDIDWEYPGASGMNFTGKPEDYANFSLLMDDIRATIGKDKLITAAFSAVPGNLKGFNWPHLAKVMDYFNMMTYDMNGGFSEIAGHNAPLYNYPGAERALSLNELTTWMLGQGIPASKINLGAPFYGRGVITQGPAGVNVPTKMEDGVEVQPDGIIRTSADMQHWEIFQGTPFYSYIRHITANGGWQDHWDEHAMVPYMTKENYFLSYDDVRSIKAKAQYIVDQQLAGVIIWTVFGDMLNMTTNNQKVNNMLTLCPDTTAPLAAAIDEVFSQSGPIVRPVLRMLSPASGTVTETGRPLTLKAEVTGVQVGTASFNARINWKIIKTLPVTGASPYTAEWIPDTPGEYELYIRVETTSGQPYESNKVKVTVRQGAPVKPPHVKLVSPVNGAQFNYPAKIALSAEATDEDGKVVEVIFFQGDQEIGKGVPSGNIWSYTWNNVAAGAYSLRAKARDDKGAETLSDAVQVTVLDKTVNYPPLVRLTAPTNNEHFNIGSAVSLVAEACDPDGDTPVVTFLVNDAKVGESSKRPYTFDWKPQKTGKYAVRAKATDTQGASSFSETVHISVTDGTVQLPEVKLIAPEDGKQFSAPAKITIEAVTTAPAGSTVEKVELYNGATPLTVITSQPYRYVLDIQASGTYTLTAKVTDSKGQTATSEPVAVIVSAGTTCTDPAWDANQAYNYGDKVSYNGKIYQAAQWSKGKNPEKQDDPHNTYWALIGPCGQNIPPVAYIKRPANDTVFNNGPITLEIEAEASAKDGVIQHVEFYNGVSLLGKITSAPYIYKWVNVPPGKYQVVAKAYDTKGAMGESAPVSFSVEGADGNLPPEVTLLSPANGQEFKENDTVPIKVKAVDPEGTITQVDIYSGTTFLQKLTQEPYIYNWKAPAGTHTIRAEATDDHNHTGSAQVLIKVHGSEPAPGDNPLAEVLQPGEWDELFPHRYNPDDWRFDPVQKIMVWTGSTLPKPEKDFFSYNNFVEAVKRMDDITLIMERRCGTTACRFTRITKSTGERKVIREDPEFNSSDWADRKIVTEELDYSTFVREGDLSARKRELAAFLANISQETTGAGAEKPVAERVTWGLFWREEVGWEEWHHREPGYRVPHDIYPPFPGKSYHGRGPIQLSYNYNYGPVSAILYGDKAVLLERPEKVLEDGALAFQTAIWFWMTPQYPKPSCHDVMIPGKWQPTDRQVQDNIRPGFGATVLIINGGVECGGPTDIDKVKNRIAYFTRYATVKGVSIELDGGDDPLKCGCARMKEFAIDINECTGMVALIFDAPVRQVVDWNGSSEIEVIVAKNDPKGEIREIFIEIDGLQHAVSRVFMWRPSGYGAHTIRLVGKRDGKPDVTEEKTFSVWNRSTGEGLAGLPQWDPQTVYKEGGYIVQYNRKAYSNQWWAGPGGPGIPATPPDQDDNWLELKFV